MDEIKIDGSNYRGPEEESDYKEIKRMMWDCNPAERSSLTVLIFKAIRSLWGTINKEFEAMLGEFFIIGDMPENGNLTWVALAHKEGESTDLKYYRLGRGPNLVKSVTEVQPSLKIPSTGLGSFYLGSRNRDAKTRWCVRTGASGAYALAPISSLGVPPKAIGTGSWVRTHRVQKWPFRFCLRSSRSSRPF
ncbi:hypothetical protein PIB30_042240 [Stylosanthes scabra]|uniref:Uncharacterized protein n=1 Tax=Stylosanthes scabra TaxID=79078 RepID=A0ABU6ZDZ5_9FABA|nr:hypothetical protein [Stylosanthes scabra]